MTAVDWKKLATILDFSSDEQEISSTDLAKSAMIEIIGTDALFSAVEQYIKGETGAAVARAVLTHLRPFVAMQYCYDIYKSERHIEEKRMAIELLRCIGDKRVIPWVADFLAEDDLEIQLWGSKIVERLLWEQAADIDDVAHLMDKMNEHPNEAVRDMFNFITNF